MRKPKPVKGVYQRGGRWWIRYRFKGRLVRQSIGTDRALAERTMEEIRRRIEDGRHEVKVKDERRRFSEMVTEYFTLKADKRSLRRDRSSFGNLIPFFGEMFLHAITKADVEAYKRARRAHVSGATVNREMALLRHLFNLAVDEGYTRDNPARRVKMFPEQKNKRREKVFSEDELQILVNSAAPHLRPILAVAVGTGLRKSDLLGLRWNQIDFEHGCITLFMQKTGGCIEIPMLPMVREALWRLKGTNGTTPYVFTYSGKKIGDIKTAVRGALRRSGLAAKGYWFHDVRRTFATMLYNRGVGLTKIQRLLGHASVLTTERYLGVKFAETREAINVLDVPALKALAAPQRISTTRKLSVPSIAIELSTAN